ncbi:hypothetical protein ACFL57_02410 [Candidatus Margulisiibacteriota bacterium]
MKKLLLYFICALLSLSIAGCGSSSSGDDAGSSLSLNSAAEYAGMTASLAQGMVPLGLGFSANVPSKLVPNMSYTYNNATGYWRYENNIDNAGTLFDTDIYVGIWATGASAPSRNEVPVDKLTMYGSYIFSSEVTDNEFRYEMTLGSEAAPLTWVGIASNAVNYSGTMEVEITVDGETAVLAYSFEDLDINTLASNYPTGTMTMSISVDGNTVFTGTVTFDGTTTAAMDLDGNNYTIDLTTGDVTAV